MSLRKKIINKYLDFTLKHYVFILLVYLMITVIFFFFAKDVKLDSSFLTLLPEDTECIKDIDIVTKKFGGEGYLIIVLENAEEDKLKAYADTIAPKIEKLKEVKFVDHRKNMEFFHDHALLYVEYEDLKELKRRFKKEQKKRSPFYLGLEDETEDKFEYKDLLDKYKEKYGLEGIDEDDSENESTANTNTTSENEDEVDDDYFEKYTYYLSPEKDLLVLLIKPSSVSGDLEFSNQLVSAVTGVLEQYPPSNVHEGMTYGLTGRYKKKLEDTEVLNNDLKVTSIISFMSIALIILLYFRRVRVLLIVLLPLVCGIVWTVGLVQIIFGVFNIITGFLIAILIGLGIDLGIHLMGRYFEKRREGYSLEDALKVVFNTTWIATLTAAFTTAFAFLALVNTSFKGISEFGVVASIGMAMIVIAMMVLFPCMSVLLEKYFPINLKKYQSKNYLEKYKGKKLPFVKTTLALGTAFILFSIYMIKYTDFDFNFNNLKDTNIPAHVLDEKISKVFEYSLWPSFAYFDNYENLMQSSDMINKLIEDKKLTTIESCSSIANSIPDKQQEKLKIIRYLRRYKNWEPLQELEGKDKRLYLRAKKLFQIDKEITKQTIPDEIKQNYKGVESNNDYFLFINPRLDISMSDGRTIKRYCNDLNLVKSKAGNVPIASETLVFGKILDIIEDEGDIILITTLILIILALFTDFKAVKPLIVILGTLFIGLTLGLGVINVLGIKFNYLNIVAIPVILGIGIDHAVHIYHRYQESGVGNMYYILRTTGVHILLASVTTMLGFGALIYANFRGLNSLGLITVIGIGTCFLSAVTITPALLYFINRKKINNSKSNN